MVNQMARTGRSGAIGSTAIVVLLMLVVGSEAAEITCVSWRQTGQCDPHGHREPHMDRTCQSVVPTGVSGYCECQEGNSIMPYQLSECGHAPFTCHDICLEAALHKTIQEYAAMDLAADGQTTPVNNDGQQLTGAALHNILQHLLRTTMLLQSHVHDLEARIQELEGDKEHGTRRAAVDVPDTSDDMPEVPMVDLDAPTVAELAGLKFMLKDAAEADARAATAADISRLLMDVPKLGPLFAPLPQDSVVFSKQHAIREAFKHAWQSYEQHAFGRDYVRPVSRQPADDMIGMGLSIIDSLDTFLIMGLPDQFSKARHWVAYSFSVAEQEDINLFETMIRVVGGLLSAYDLTRDTMFLSKARDTTDKMMHAFDSPTGLPYGTLGIKSKKRYNPDGGSSTSELGTLQVELFYLSRVTGDPKYAVAAEKITRHLESMAPPDGLFPIYIKPDSGEFMESTITLGARGDSVYEYFLKQWMLFGDRREEKQWIKTVFDKSVHGIIDKLLQTSTPSGFRYIAELTASQQLSHKMDHLVCFLPGVLALASQYGDAGNVTASDLLNLARELMHTCYVMYEQQVTGLAPEIVLFSPGQDFAAKDGAKHSLLRPEVVESLFVMFRITNDPVYRVWGWRIFLALDKHAKIEEGGFSGLQDVTAELPAHNDHMDSFFLAETLKYLYLLFSDSSFLPLDKYVFNTEAHPLSIFSYMAGEASIFGDGK